MQASGKVLCVMPGQKGYTCYIISTILSSQVPIGPNYQIYQTAITYRISIFIHR